MKHRLILRAAAALAGVLLMLPAASRAEAADKPFTVIAFGDSLTAGYGLSPREAFPAQLQMALAAKGFKVQVMNAGVSGDTTAGGLSRIDWTLQDGAGAVILELGANDALRGIDPKETRANLDKMLALLKSRNIPVLIAGMKAPSNWGKDYQASFDAIFPELAKQYNAPLYPFFLEGVALNPQFVLPDGLHPTGLGIGEIVKRILPDVEALLLKAGATASTAEVK